MYSNYDVIVVGAGHAGCEAAHSAAIMGSKVLLITMNLRTIGQMSCNPAMGGIAKGQIVREIDALGGMSGIVSDKTAIQFKMLNKSKGLAMWSPRTQNDRVLFSLEWRQVIEKNKNIDLWQGTAKKIIVEKNKVAGIETDLGYKIKSKTVVLTNGTFLNGIIHIGINNLKGGRVSENSSLGITECLNSLGFKSDRMKTGTPPRLDARSINLESLLKQPGDKVPKKFSYSDKTKPIKKQRDCWMVYTNPIVHEILEEGFEFSPMYLGRIKGKAPRYCPSIEDKIKRFSDKTKHQLFVEPEGWNTCELYLNGFSTSLSLDTQIKALKHIEGFENVKVFSPGYAIEYDFFQPTQLKETLETKDVKNLFFAGQINGTTGYEEAAAQGLIAGINANLNCNNKPPFSLKRNEAYIGVLIDDLVTKGTEEPYRMFTSRAEHRLLLRQDNADIRLTEKSYKIGLASEERINRVKEKIHNSKNILESIEKEKIEPAEINSFLENKKLSKIKEKQTFKKILVRPQVKLDEIIELFPDKFNKTDKEALFDAEVNIKYEPYIKKESELVNKQKKSEGHKIPNNINYNQINSVSMEAREKLKKIKPETLGQASRISGISPSDVLGLQIYIERKKNI